MKLMISSLMKQVEVEVYTNRVIIKTHQKQGGQQVKEYIATDPFSSSRLLVANFEVAEKFMRYAFKDMGVTSVFGVKPPIKLTTKEKNEGGICEIEWRALVELMERAGASFVEVDGIKNINGMMT